MGTQWRAEVMGGGAEFRFYSIDKEYQLYFEQRIKMMIFRF